MQAWILEFISARAPIPFHLDRPGIAVELELTCPLVNLGPGRHLVECHGLGQLAGFGRVPKGGARKRLPPDPVLRYARHVDPLHQLPLWVAWLAIGAGALSAWGGYRHYRQSVDIPLFSGITGGFWITVFLLVVQGVALAALGVWRLAAEP